MRLYISYFTCIGKFIVLVYITVICKTKTENKRKINKHLAVNKVKNFSDPLPFRPQKNYILNRKPYARTLHAFIRYIFCIDNTI